MKYSTCAYRVQGMSATSVASCRLPLGLAVAVFLFVGTAQAGRPLLTDDATIVDQCQLESWWEREGDSAALWAMPACNIAGMEWAAGAAKTGRQDHNLYELSVKAELKPQQINHFGVTAQVSHEFEAAGSMAGDTHVNIAVTHSLLDDALQAHFNIGQLIRPEERNDWTAGAALEWQSSESGWVFAELYREQARYLTYQMGYLVEVLPDRLQLDLSYGNHVFGSSRERLLSLGLVFYFEAPG